MGCGSWVVVGCGLWVMGRGGRGGITTIQKEVISWQNLPIFLEHTIF